MDKILGSGGTDMLVTDKSGSDFRKFFKVLVISINQ